MSKPSLSEIEGRAEGATEGPWDVEDVNVVAPALYDRDDDSYWISEHVAHAPTATFIAAARTDVPAMAAAIRAVLDALDVKNGHVWVASHDINGAVGVTTIRAALAAHLDLT